MTDPILSAYRKYNENVQNESRIDGVILKITRALAKTMYQSDDVKQPWK